MVRPTKRRYRLKQGIYIDENNFDMWGNRQMDLIDYI